MSKKKKARHKIVQVFYPMDEAVQRAAVQNYQRDLYVMGLNEVGFYRGDTQEIYESEARYLMETTGENWIPEEPHYEHICLKSDD